MNHLVSALQTKVNQLHADSIIKDAYILQLADEISKLKAELKGIDKPE